MVNETNFIIRVSGRKENTYYIDYLGVYKTTEIARIVGLEAPSIQEKYLSNGAFYEKELDVYYFNSIERAKKAISDILGTMRQEQRGRLIYLTESEVEYIRKALINEGSNILHVSSSIKDAIFRKLNS
jgi:hypothetical protein